MGKPRRSSRYTYPAVEVVAAVLVTARPLFPWEREAPVRHHIRAMLVLQGMRWPRADFMGHSIVARARSRNGTGQPKGWDSDNELAQWLPPEDSWCPICGRPFVPRWSRQVFCSSARSRRQAEREQLIELTGGACAPPHCEFCRRYVEVGRRWAHHDDVRFCSKRCS